MTSSFLAYQLAVGSIFELWVDPVAGNRVAEVSKFTIVVYLINDGLTISSYQKLNIPTPSSSLTVVNEAFQDNLLALRRNSLPVLEKLCCRLKQANLLA
ncbi:hypothetical protein ACOSQ3_030345 [Xanthoceras sorbifolium]